MVEPERTPVLTLDELLRLSGADRPDAAAHEEEDSEDVLRRLFSDAEEPPAAAEEPPSSAPLATAAATLASLFGVEEAARADGGDPLPADCAPSFDLFAAFGAASGDDAPESLSASPQQDSSDGGKDARPFSLSDALGVEAPAAPQRDEPAAPREEPRALRGRFASFGVGSAARQRPAAEQRRSEPQPAVKLQPVETPSSDGAESAAKPKGDEPAAFPTPAPAAAEPPTLSEPSASERARAAFDEKAARKRLPSGEERPSEPAEKASGKPAAARRPACAEGSDRKEVASADERKERFEEAPSKPKPPLAENPQDASVAQPVVPFAVGPATVPVRPVREARRTRGVDKAETHCAPASSGADGIEGRRRRFMFAGVALVAVAALAGSFALAMALDGGSAAVSGETSPLATLAVGPRQVGEGSVEYRYRVRGSDGGLGRAVERAEFGADGMLLRSFISVDFPSADQADAFLDDACEAFGDSLEDGSVSGASVSLVVGAQGQPVDRATYAELLRRGAIDCEVIER